MAYGDKPYGIVEINLYPLDAAGAPGAALPLPTGNVLEFTPNSDRKELLGLGKTIARYEEVKDYDVTLNLSGVPAEVIAAITGDTIVTTGVTPSRVKRLEEGSATATRPYLQVVGRALGRGSDGGDLHIALRKVQFDRPPGGFNEADFQRMSLRGKAVYTDAGKVIERIWHETPVAVTTAS